MYTLLFNNLILYDPRDDAKVIRDPAVHLSVGEPGSLSFTIDKDHQAVGRLTKMKGVLELQDDGVPIYRGRIVRDVEDFNLSRTIESEGLLACLNDSIVPPFDFPADYEDDDDYKTAAESGNVVAFLLAKWLETHNAQVSPEQEIKLGKVTVLDPNNYISRSSSEYQSTWEAIKSKLAGSSLGGYLLPRYEADGVYLDYLADFELTNTQDVEFAVNLLDLQTEDNVAEIFTAILPVGAEGLTIKELPDGDIDDDRVKEGLLIYSKRGISQYGKITKTETWDDVTQASNLKSKAADFLSGAGIARTISIKAADLHNESGASFRVGRYTRLTSTPHNYNVLLPLVTLEPDIINPGNTQITLGESLKTQTERIQAATNAAADRADRQELEIKKQSSDLNEVVEATNQQITSAIQTSESLIFEALTNYAEKGDLESYKETVSAQLSILSDTIEINLNTATEKIESINGDLQGKYSNFEKFFRFTEDGLYIGESGNEILLRLDNDIIQFLRNNVPGLWMDEKGTHADEVHTQTLRIGDFVLTADPDGRVSFRRID